LLLFAISCNHGRSWNVLPAMLGTTVVVCHYDIILVKVATYIILQ
jgi:hypothetical protein